MDLQFPEVTPRYGEDPKTGNEPAWDSTYDRSAREWCNAAYEEADYARKQDEELKKIGEFIDYIEGRQWKGNRPSYKSKPVNNKIQDNFWETVGLLTDIKPIMDVKSTNPEMAYQDASRVINKGIKSWALNTDYDLRLALTVAYAILTTGFHKFQWNPELNSGQGELEAVPLGPNDLLLLKPKLDLQSSLAVIRDEEVTMGWLKRRYPTRGHLVKPDTRSSSYSIEPQAPAHIPSMLWDVMSDAIKRTVGGQAQTKSSAFPMARYREFWFRDYCVSPDTRVLSACLKWVRADSLTVGDELVGCDEDPISCETKKGRKRVLRERWLRKTIVESIKRLRQPCVEIVTDKGTVSCSALHRWLVKCSSPFKGENSRGTLVRYEWKRAQNIEVGDKIAFLCSPWEEENSRDSGYLAGLFDGEGWLTKYDLGFAQRPGEVLHRGISLLEQRGYKVYTQQGKSGVVQVKVNGGRSETLRFVGSIRPHRLIANCDIAWRDKLMHTKNVGPATVLSLKHIGEHEVISIQTDRKTFIAEGLISHNSTNTSNVPVWMGKYNWRYKVDPGKPLYPRGRLICRGGDTALHDGPNPYWHGMYPFSMLRLNIVPWRLYGLSDVRHWISLQDILNQILAGIIDMIKRSVNPGFFAPKNAFSEAVWNSLDFSKPGERAGYSQQTTHEPKFAPAPVMPGYVMQVYGMVEKSLDQLVGRSVASALAGKKQVPGSDTIESMNFMRTTPTRLKGRNIETFMRDSGALLIPSMLQFYTDKRRMTMLGPGGMTAADFDWDPGTMVPSGVNPEEFVKGFRFFVQPGSLLNTEKNQKIMNARALRLSGDLSRKTLFRIIDEGLDAEQEEKEIARERKANVGMIPPKGHGGKAKGLQ